VVENTASLSSTAPQATILTTVPPDFDLCYPWPINVHVPCEEGCTLTQGYWKTHAGIRPARAPYDDTWNLIGAQGANTLFYLSGISYYDVLREPPRGNVYYILARQFIAARLNTLNGASTTPEADAALAEAELFLPVMVLERLAILAKRLETTPLLTQYSRRLQQRVCRSWALLGRSGVTPECDLGEMDSNIHLSEISAGSAREKSIDFTFSFARYARAGRGLRERKKRASYLSKHLRQIERSSLCFLCERREYLPPFALVSSHQFKPIN